MKNFIKTSAKVLYNYVVVLILYILFIQIFLSVTKEMFNELLSYYCMVFFVFTFLLIYLDMKKLAVKEKKPQNDLNPYPLKGLIYGLVGVIPLALIVVIGSVIRFENAILQNIKHIGINVLLGPMYFIIRWLKEEPIGYVAAIFTLPVISMLGYLAGYLGIDIAAKTKKKKPVTEREFIKSPWNPTNTAKTTRRKKKNK